jgi:hypothetical protein
MAWSNLETIGKWKGSFRGVSGPESIEWFCHEWHFLWVREYTYLYSHYTCNHHVPYNTTATPFPSVSCSTLQNLRAGKLPRTAFNINKHSRDFPGEAPVNIKIMCVSFSPYKLTAGKLLHNRNLKRFLKHSEDFRGCAPANFRFELTRVPLRHSDLQEKYPTDLNATRCPTATLTVVTCSMSS